MITNSIECRNTKPLLNLSAPPPLPPSVFPFRQVRHSSSSFVFLFFSAALSTTLLRPCTTEVSVEEERQRG